jgi:hypothetical protein
MATTSSENWKPGKPVLQWAWISIIALICGSWIGAIFVFVKPVIAISALVVSLPVFYFALLRLWLEIGRAKEIPGTIKTRLRRNLLFFGPVAVQQILLYNYFPDSRFSGLRVKPK